jgi:hypothetical protein
MCDTFLNVFFVKVHWVSPKTKVNNTAPVYGYLCDNVINLHSERSLEIAGKLSMCGFSHSRQRRCNNVVFGFNAIVKKLLATA